jgi:hypothetical protein
MYDLENVHAFFLSCDKCKQLKNTVGSEYSLKRRAVHQLETTHNFFKRKEAGAKGTT